MLSVHNFKVVDSSHVIIPKKIILYIYHEELDSFPFPLLLSHVNEGPSQVNKGRLDSNHLKLGWFGLHLIKSELTQFKSS